MLVLVHFHHLSELEVFNIFSRNPLRNVFLILEQSESFLGLDVKVVKVLLHSSLDIELFDCLVLNSFHKALSEGQ